MKQKAFSRHKTEDSLRNRPNKRHINFPTLHYSEKSRKVSNSMCFTEINANSMSESDLIRVSSTSEPVPKALKRCLVESYNESNASSPTKVAIRLKSVQFPSLGNSEGEDNISSPKAKAQSQARKRNERLQSVIKDCQRLKNMMDNVTRRSSSNHIHQGKDVNEVTLKNIFIPPQPLGLPGGPKADAGCPLQWMKQQQSPKFQHVTKISVRQNIFLMPSCHKGTP